jgi:GTP pyrophosphokinase
MKVIKKLGFKTATDFYAQISNEQLDPANIIDGYLSLEQKAPDPVVEGQSATDYIMQPAADTADGKQSDVLVIGDDVKGLNYRMARCCNPIYGDPVFGFVSAEGVIKIHRYDCPNAANIREKYPYRIITTRWSGKIGQQFAATLRVVGHDDIGIVTNITSIINKESSTSLRLPRRGGGRYGGSQLANEENQDSERSKRCAT